MGQERAEALAGGAVALDVDGVVRQAVVAVARGHGARQHGADGAVAVAHRHDERDLLAAFQRGLAALDQLVVQRAGQAVVLLFGLAHVGVGLGLVEHAGEVQALRLPVFDARAHVEQVGAADQVVELADAQLGHDLAHFLGDEEEEVDDVLGLALELLAQHRILRGHAHRAGVQVALAHHDAAFDDQRRRGEAELVGAQQSADDDVAAGLHLAVGLHADAAAQRLIVKKLLPTSTAGSLPKPSWLAEPETLWSPWKLQDGGLIEGKQDALRLSLQEQQHAGIDIVSDGEQTRQHFVTTFIEHLDGVDFENRKTVRIRDRYDASVPTVVGAVARRKPVFVEDAKFLRQQTKQPIKWALPGPMTMIDTLYDDHYKSREKLAWEFAKILNQEAKELEAAGVDIIQFDEPAFNVFFDEVNDWGVATLERAIEGL
uniref:Uncharacterized protein LOC102810278 n=1 Tax=Saccoglossus kowalevskii TaxID=10224 RepID=A0ABM0MLP6_SACKO